jgi:hypothetical protein
VIRQALGDRLAQGPLVVDDEQVFLAFGHGGAVPAIF